MYENYSAYYWFFTFTCLNSIVIIQIIHTESHHPNCDAIIPDDAAVGNNEWICGYNIHKNVPPIVAATNTIKAAVTNVPIVVVNLSIILLVYNCLF